MLQQLDDLISLSSLLPKEALDESLQMAEAYCRRILFAGLDVPTWHGGFLPQGS